MPYFVYIIHNISADVYYIGHTNDPKRRLDEHNGSRTRWTKRHQPWQLIFTEQTASRAKAIGIEKYLKSLKNKERIKQYIAGWRSSIPLKAGLITNALFRLYNPQYIGGCILHWPHQRSKTAP